MQWRQRIEPFLTLHFHEHARSYPEEEAMGTNPGLFLRPLLFNLTKVFYLVTHDYTNHALSKRATWGFETSVATEANATFPHDPGNCPRGRRPATNPRIFLVLSTGLGPLLCLKGFGRGLRCSSGG